MAPIMNGSEKGRSASQLLSFFFADSLHELKLLKEVFDIPVFLVSTRSALFSTVIFQNLNYCGCFSYNNSP